jgi:uncharacterized phage protein gp47/JayE
LYEGRTYDFLLNRMLERVAENYPLVDTREGSIIFDALAPEALELAIAYVELEQLRNETFILTATREGKLQRCIEQGIDVSIFEATPGSFRGEFNIEVPIGSRWNLDLYNYTVVETLGQNEDTQYYEYVLRCETSGTAPNSLTGDLTPINETYPGLTHAAITATVVEGENESSNDAIDEYYINYVNNIASDGNKAQYEKWCQEFPGIGNYKVFPRWNGANTVKVSILSASNGTATEELINDFQEYLDPGITGMGNGVAPIGAFVTVSTATTLTINITADVILKSGYVSTSAVEPAVKAYLNEIAYNGNTVSYIGIAAAILNAEGIANVSNVQLNGAMTDIMLGDEQIPVLGSLNLEVIS